MNANKRVRDLARRSPIRLVAVGSDGVRRGTTTYPYAKLPREYTDGVREQKRIANIEIHWRER